MTTLRFKGNLIQFFTRFLVVSLLVIPVFSARPVFASFADTCSGDTGSYEDDPSPLAILCSLARVIRVFVYAAGLVFIAVGGYGAWKVSMALGDPKALAGARLTWTYGVFGFFVVLGFFALFSVVTSLLGIDTVFSIEALMERMYSALAEILDQTGVKGY